MNKSKINEFISKLQDPNLPEEQQSYILATDESDICAGDNLGAVCSNKETVACSGTNDKCTNYGVCQTSTNRGGCNNLATSQTEIGSCNDKP